MNKQDFIRAFNEGHKLVNGDITLQKDGYFSLFGEFLLKTTDIEDTDVPRIVIVGNSKFPGGMNLHIAVDNWEVKE